MDLLSTNRAIVPVDTKVPRSLAVLPFRRDDYVRQSSGIKSTPRGTLAYPCTGLSRLRDTLCRTSAPCSFASFGFTDRRFARSFPPFREVISRVPMPRSRLICTFGFRLPHARHAVRGRFRREHRWQPLVNLSNSNVNWMNAKSKATVAD